MHTSLVFRKVLKSPAMHVVECMVEAHGEIMFATSVLILLSKGLLIVASAVMLSLLSCGNNLFHGMPTPCFLLCFT